jgi:hypothetical protein
MYVRSKARPGENHRGSYPALVIAWNEEAMSRVRAQLDEAAFADAWEQGRPLTVDEAVALALDAVD